MRWTYVLKACGTVLVWLLNTANAACVGSSYLRTDDSYQARIAFGNLNLTDAYLQPPGTLLSTAVVPSTSFNKTGAVASTVLWTCDIADKNSVMFLVAVNGRDRLGGNSNMSAYAGGVTYVYATWFQYVGLRLSMNGRVITRSWEPIPIPSYLESGGKIHIRLGDIPPLLAEAYKISAIPSLTAAPSNGCASLGTQGMGVAPVSGTINYQCWRANAYIQLYGGGILSDFMGQDSATDFVGVSAFNGFPYGMWESATLSAQQTCRVTSSNSSVTFPPISVSELEQGLTRHGTFAVQLECGNGVSSGLNAGETAIGIQVSDGAYAAATQLNLVSNGAALYLVSDDYLTDTSLAKGVGISIANAQTMREQLFLGPSLASTGLPNSGWYPVLEGATMGGGSATPGYSTYTQNYIATLSKLPGQNVTAGKVHATGYVQVRVQ